MKPEIEDGMGFSGLVPTRAEREQDRRDQAERKRIKALEARVTVLEAALRGVIRVADRKTVEFDAARVTLDRRGEHTKENF